MDYVLIAIVASLLFFVLFAFCFVVLSDVINNCKYYEKTGHACPNCGKHIHVSWKKLILQPRVFVIPPVVLYMRCPNCNKIDRFMPALDTEYTNEPKNKSKKD